MTLWIKNRKSKVEYMNNKLACLIQNFWFFNIKDEFDQPSLCLFHGFKPQFHSYHAPHFFTQHGQGLKIESSSIFCNKSINTHDITSQQCQLFILRLLPQSMLKIWKKSLCKQKFCSHTCGIFVKLVKIVYLAAHMTLGMSKTDN